MGPSSVVWKSGKVRKIILFQRKMQIKHYKKGVIYNTKVMVNGPFYTLKETMKHVNVITDGSLILLCFLNLFEAGVVCGAQDSDQ